MLYCATLYYIILYYTKIYYIILYHTVLYLTGVHYSMATFGYIHFLGLSYIYPLYIPYPHQWLVSARTPCRCIRWITRWSHTVGCPDRVFGRKIVNIGKLKQHKWWFNQQKWWFNQQNCDLIYKKCTVESRKMAEKNGDFFG